MENNEGEIQTSSCRSVVITIPQYIEEVKFSDARRKHYWRSTDKLPAYVKERLAAGIYVWKTVKLTNKKERRIYDVREKQYAVKNIQTAGTPNVRQIAGNYIYSGTAEHVRMKMIDTIKECFRKYLPSTISLHWPVKLEAHLYAPPRFCNWDLDNLWIYIKAFQDLLVEQHLVPDDSILYITRSTGFQYTPITDNNERKMQFILTEDDRDKIRRHVMYNLHPKKAFIMGPFLFSKDHAPLIPHINRMTLVTTTAIGKPGDLIIDLTDETFTINIGKSKVIHGAVIKALGRVFSQAIQLNAYISISPEFYKEFSSFIDSELCSKGIFVVVINKISI